MSIHFQVLSLHYKGDVGEFESRHIFVSLIIIEMMCQTVYLFPFLVSVVRVGCNSLCSIHRFLDSTEVHGISIENKGRERRESSLVGIRRHHYNTVSFIPDPHNRHLIARPWGRGMRCLLWIETDLYSASINAVLYETSCYIGPCYNSTHFDWVLVILFADHWLFKTIILMTPWYGNVFHTTGPLCRIILLVAGGFQWKGLIEYAY